MINYFIIYFCISGFLCWTVLTHGVTDLDKRKQQANGKELQKIQELESFIYVNFGSAFDKMLPTLQLFCLLFGWLLIPMALCTILLDKLNKKVE
jgi:hypothetical protein